MTRTISMEARLVIHSRLGAHTRRVVESVDSQSVMNVGKALCRIFPMGNHP